MGQVRVVLLWILCLSTNALGTHPVFAAEMIPAPAKELVVEYTRAVDEARRKYGDAARLALEKWNARLDELIGVAKSKGNLDAVLALQAERDGAERSVVRGPVKVPPKLRRPARLTTKPCGKRSRSSSGLSTRPM